MNMCVEIRQRRKDSAEIVRNVQAVLQTKAI